MIRLGMIVVGVSDMDRGLAFWSAALGLRPQENDATWSVLEAATPGAPPLALQLSESSPEKRPRLHLDLFADNAADQHRQVERLLALGATHVDWEYPPDPDFTVLSDPDGNVFCVVDSARYAAAHGS